MIYSKSNPVGVDAKINSMQTRLHEIFLAAGLLTAQVDLYPRVYKLKEDAEVTPVKFITKEYSKALFTTDKALVSYFYERTDPENVNGLYSVQVGNVFHVNLPVYFSTITTRADYEFIKVITGVYAIEPYGFRLQRVVSDNPLGDFNFDEASILPPWFTFRVDLNLNYRI